MMIIKPHNLHNLRNKIFLNNNKEIDLFTYVKIKHLMWKSWTVLNKRVHLQGSRSLKGLMGSGDTTGW